MPTLDAVRLARLAGNRAARRALGAGVGTKGIVQRNPDDAVTEVQPAALSAWAQEVKQEISQLQKSEKLGSTSRERLEAVWSKMAAFQGQLSQGDPMALWEGLTEWMESSVWEFTSTGGRGGLEAWEEYLELSMAARTPEEVVGEAGPKYSAQCEAVFEDMERQFNAWDGTLTRRGAWWGSRRPGSTSGAKKVPTDAIPELKKKVGGTPWRFSDSWSGGISFHRARGSVDFIYHMLPP